MGNYERGVYEPSDEVRVFDAAEDEEDVEGSRLPLLIVLALVVLAMFGGVVYLAYTQGVAKGRGEVPVLTAASGPARVAPAQPGGAQVPYQGFKIYEQPAPPDDAADAAPTGNAPAANTGAGQTTVQTVQPAPQPQPAQTAPLPAQETPKPAPPPSRPEPAKAAAAAPAPKPAPVPAAAQPTPPVSAPTGIATAPPRSLSPAPATTSAAARPAPAAPGSYFLQIGAYKSQADTEAAWKSFQARHATLLAGHGLDVQRVDLGEKGIWYRARVGGFLDRDVASAMCDRLKADGGSCFLAR